MNLHDAIDQITQVEYGRDVKTTSQARQVDYTYDPAGNRLGMTENADGSGPGAAVLTPYTASSINQYTAIDGLAAPAYDANGNTILLQTKLGDPAWTYQWDAQNRLIGGSNGATSFSFAYDPRNRCVVRTITSLNTPHLTLNLFYDDWSLIEERTSADALHARHIHGAVLDEVLCSITDVGGNSVTSYLHYDGLGSVTALTDVQGAFAERYTYDAYGTPTIYNSASIIQNASSIGNRFLFTGREWFAELRLNDHRNRYYTPEVGRWLSRD